jgi:hypothetical protein
MSDCIEARAVLYGISPATNFVISDRAVSSVSWVYEAADEADSKKDIPTWTRIGSVAVDI